MDTISRGFSTCRIVRNVILLGFSVSTTVLGVKTFLENLVDMISLVFSWKKITLPAGGYGHAWVFAYPPGWVRKNFSKTFQKDFEAGQPPRLLVFVGPFWTRASSLPSPAGSLNSLDFSPYCASCGQQLPQNQGLQSF